MLIITFKEKFSTGDGKGNKGVDTAMIIGGIVGN